MSKPPPPAPTASAIGPCPTVIKIVGRPGTGSLPSTIAPPDHPQAAFKDKYFLLQRTHPLLCNSPVTLLFHQRKYPISHRIFV